MTGTNNQHTGTPMQWQDFGIIIGMSRLSESSLRLDVLTAEHGRSGGLVRGGASAKRKHLFDLGNMVAVTWRGRLSEQLGSYTVELLAQPASRCLHDPLRLGMISATSGLMQQCLVDRSPEVELYQAYHQLLSAMDAPLLELLSHYVHFEVALLTSSGIPLDFDQCVATGSTQELIYLSPKSGRAVSRAAGLAHHDKWFALPAFMRHAEGVADSLEDIQQALAITSYFLEHVANDMLHKPLCNSRARLVGLVGLVGKEG